jgi:hypothetical protein
MWRYLIFVISVADLVKKSRQVRKIWQKEKGVLLKVIKERPLTGAIYSQPADAGYRKPIMII